MSGEQVKAVTSILRPNLDRPTDDDLGPACAILSQEFGDQYSKDFLVKWRLLQELPGEVCIKDWDSKMIWWNRALSVRAGCEPDLAGASMTFLWGPEVGRWIHDMDRLALKVNRPIFHGEPENRDPRFANEPFAVSIRFPLPIKGNPLGYVASIAFGFNDRYVAHAAAAALGQTGSRTERPQYVVQHPRRGQGVEEQLLNFSDLLDAFCRNVPSEICAKSADSKLLWCNEQFEDLVGMKLEKLRNTPPEWMWGEDRAKTLRGWDNEVLTKGEPKPYKDELQADASGQPRERFGIRFPINGGRQRMVGCLGFDSFDPLVTEMIQHAFNEKGAWPSQSRPGARWFISHCSKDFPFVADLKSHLEQRGVVCYVSKDHSISGQPLWETLEREIRKHDRFVVVLSESSLTSSNVKHEVSYARSQKHGLIHPIFLAAEGVLRAHLSRQADGGDWLWLLDIAAVDFTASTDQSRYLVALRQLLEATRTVIPLSA